MCLQGQAYGAIDSCESSDSSSSAYRRRAASIEWPPRKQPRTVETIEVGCLNVISAKYEVCIFQSHSRFILYLFGTEYVSHLLFSIEP